ncbi:MAG: hypothetical protein K0R34_2026 [Herbinix sp.]|nr:hypothetical protein [Herbinix sp.]
MKDKLVKFIKRILVQILCIIVFLALCLLIALLISHFSGIILRTVMVYEGFILVLVGALLSPKSGRSIINVNGLDQPSATQMAYRDLEVNRLEQEFERENPSYYKDFYSGVKGSAHNLTLILSGGIMLMYALNYL